MNEVKILDHTNKKALRRRVNQIVSMYNAHYRALESHELKYPEKCKVAYIDGFKGGIISESYGEDGNETFSIIFYACFEEKDRRKGFARRCVQALQKRLNLVGVQVDVGNDPAVWQALGFTTQSMLNLVPTYINITKAEFTHLNKEAGGKGGDGQGIGINDLFEILAHRNAG